MSEDLTDSLAEVKRAVKRPRDSYRLVISSLVEG